MKNALIAAGVSILILACTGPATAQEIELSPQMKVWEPVLGKWSGEEEFRDSPTGTWAKYAVEWENRSGGYFLQTHWSNDRGGKENSSVELIGYDPVKQCFVSIFLTDEGLTGAVTSAGWDGTTINVNGTNALPDGTLRTIRFTWEYSSDLKTTDGIGEQFTDGKWWTFLKI